MCNIKPCFKGKIKKIKDTILMEDKYLLWILSHWIITSSVFIFGFWNNGALKDFVKSPVIFFYNIIVILLIFIFMLFKLKSLRYFNILLSLYLSSISYILFTMGNKDIKGSFTLFNSLIPIIGNIWLFNFILYNEKIERDSNTIASHIHKRYLEYFKTYIWVVIFGMLGYYTWQLDKSAAKFAQEPEKIRQEFISVMNYPVAYPLSRSLLQIGVSAFWGIILISHAFHVKLKEIEKAM